MATKLPWRRRVVCATAVATGLVLLAVAGFAWMARGPFVAWAPHVATEPADAARLEKTVRVLSEECVPRSFREPDNLERAAAFIEQSFRDGGDAPESQAYELPAGRSRDVLARRPGTVPGASTLVPDLVGLYCDEPGCQPYPFPGMALFHPSRGDFIAVTATSARRARSGRPSAASPRRAPSPSSPSAGRATWATWISRTTCRSGTPATTPCS